MQAPPCSALKVIKSSCFLISLERQAVIKSSSSINYGLFKPQLREVQAVTRPLPPVNIAALSRRCPLPSFSCTDVGCHPLIPRAALLTTVTYRDEQYNRISHDVHAHVAGSSTICFCGAEIYYAKLIVQTLPGSTTMEANKYKGKSR